jgi:predicted dienelactone hydrolase
MITDILVVLAVAGIAVAVVFFLFNSVSEVPTSKKNASKILAEVAAKDAQKKAKPQPKKSKKDLEADKLREKELEELIAREAVASKGMPSERFQVTTLDDHKAKAKAKAAGAKGKTPLAESKSASFSEEQKAKERAHGFKIVEAKEDKKESASPVNTGSKTHSGTRRASPQSPAASKREELEKKLGQFFKSSKRRNHDDDYTPAAKATNSSASQERVKAPQTAGGAGANAWSAEREW